MSLGERRNVRKTVCFARETGNASTHTSRALGTVQSALGVGGRGREIFILVTCSLQFAKAGSAATQSQQEKKNTADVQRGRVNIKASCGQWQDKPRGDVSLASSSHCRVIGRSFAQAPTHVSGNFVLSTDFCKRNASL